MAKSLKNRKEDFIKKSKQKFGDKFDYSKVIYIDSNTPIILICPIHGEFSILPKSHLASETGCKKCCKQHPKKLIDGKDRKLMREYRIWKGIKTRTHNKNIDDADRYINRGITMCERWYDFETFYNDMGPCPEGYSIDRIDNNLGYFPENCRWTDYYTQSRNRSTFNKVFTYDGRSLTLKEWSIYFNIKYTTLYQRIYRSGLSFEDAIKKDSYNKLIDLNGEKHSLKEWCIIKNIEFMVVINRIHKHKWSYEDALNTPKGGKRNIINK